MVTCMSRLRGLPQSAQCGSDWTMLRGSGVTVPSSWFSLTRAPLTVERLPAAMRGPSVVQRRSGKHSSYVGDGLFFHSSVVIYMLTIDSFSILPALSLHDGILH